MSQYNKIIDMETDNTYIFNLSEEDYLRASKGKIFFKYSFFDSFEYTRSKKG